jgi:glycosyltransferase involved in cell wall biosynthesis
MALFWYKVKNIPFVLTVHDPNQHPGLSKLLNLYHDFLQKFFSKKAQRIIVHGPSMHAQYLKKYPKINPACVVDLPHGDLSVCLNFHQQSFSREKKGDYTILFFGTIRPDKGVEYLIKAEPYIAQEIDNFIIKILGNDDFSIADTFIKDPCRFEVNNSYIPHSDVPRYFHEADVVVLPYISATQSGIIPLAYAAGKPVIATRTGGLPDVVLDGKTGFLVEPRDEKTLATAIVAILKDDKLRKEMGENALAFCKENLSWSQIGIKTYNLYRQITNNLN